MTTRRVVVSGLVLAGTGVAVGGCWPLLRLVVRGGMGRSLTAAGRLMARGTAVTNAGRMAVLGRATTASLTTYTRAVAPNATSLRVVDSGGRQIAHIEKSVEAVNLVNAQGNRLLRSATSGPRVTHFDPLGREVGHSLVRDNGATIAHFERGGRRTGFDRIRTDRIEHFDHADQFMGSSRIERASAQQVDIRGTAGLQEMVYLTTAMAIYNDPEISVAYREFRNMQARCYDQGDEIACAELKFLSPIIQRVISDANL